MILIIEVIVGRKGIVINLKVIVDILMKIRIMIKKEIKKIKKKAPKKVKLTKTKDKNIKYIFYSHYI